MTHDPFELLWLQYRDGMLRGLNAPPEVLQFLRRTFYSGGIGFFAAQRAIFDTVTERFTDPTRQDEACSDAIDELVERIKIWLQTQGGPPVDFSRMKEPPQ